MWVYSNQLICFSDCCVHVAVTTQNEGNGLRIRRHIFRIDSDKKFPLDDNGNNNWVSLSEDSTIFYNADELGWAIGQMNQSKPFLRTEKDPQAIDKCPHDSSLTWMRVEDPLYSNKSDEDDISVDCVECVKKKQ